MCEYYCQRIDIDEAAGELLRIDAREQSDVLDEVTDIGLDIDEGMVVKANDRIYYGSEAIHQLALMGSRKGIVSRSAYWVFRSKTAARILYPMLAACRKLLLKLLGRTRINNLGLDNNDRF